MQKCRTHLLGKTKKRRLQRCRNDLFKVIVLKIWPVRQNITLLAIYGIPSRFLVHTNIKMRKERFHKNDEEYISDTFIFT